MVGAVLVGVLETGRGLLDPRGRRVQQHRVLSVLVAMLFAAPDGLFGRPQSSALYARSRLMLPPVGRYQRVNDHDQADGARAGLALSAGPPRSRRGARRDSAARRLHRRIYVTGDGFGGSTSSRAAGPHDPTLAWTTPARSISRRRPAFSGGEFDY